MDGCFMNQLLGTYRLHNCSCLEKQMESLKDKIIHSQGTFKSIQNLLKCIPHDLKIICEDRKEFPSHKLLFGLLNPTLATIFLDEDLISEKLTLFLPIYSEHLDTMINDEFLLKSKLEDIFSTSLHCSTDDRDVIKYLQESRSIELIKAEGNYECKDEENQSRESDNGDLVEEEGEIINPVRISFKKEERKKRKTYLKTKRKKIIDQGPFPCEDCGKICRNLVALKSHRKNNHSNPENVLQQCDKCSYSTLYPYLLDQHIKAQHDVIKFQCTECGKSFYGQKLYKAHYDRMHTKQELFKCKECGKEFTKHRLKMHISLMHRERRFSCHLCSYKAQTGYNLKLHISKSHLGIKTLPKQKCPHCEIETTNLEWHIKTSHKHII